MTFKPLFGPITILPLSFVTFRVSHFPVLHLTHETVKLGLQNTLNMSKTTRVYFGVLHEVPIPRPERYFRDVCLPNFQLMITGAKVYLRVDSRLS